MKYDLYSDNIITVACEKKHERSFVNYISICMNSFAHQQRSPPPVFMVLINAENIISFMLEIMIPNYCFFMNRKERISISYLVLSSLVTGAAYTDFKYNKVFNSWILAGLFIGILTQSYNGPAGGIQALTSIAISLLILVPIYLVKGIGAGDVKLFAAIAAFLSTDELIQCIVLSFLIGGLISFFCVIKNRTLKQTIHFALPIMISTLFVAGGI